MSSYNPNMSLQPSQPTGQELLTSLYNASQWFELLRMESFAEGQSNADLAAIRLDLCEELCALFDKMSKGAFNVSGFPAYVSHLDGARQQYDIPYKPEIKVAEDGTETVIPVSLELAEFLGMRESGDGDLALEIAYPLAGIDFMEECTTPHAYIFPLTSITEVTEVAYFDNFMESLTEV